MVGIPIIIFGSLKANLIFYGGILVIFVIIVIVSSLGDSTKSRPSSYNNTRGSFNKDNIRNKGRPNNDSIPRRLIVRNIDELTNELVISYYQLEENINIRALYRITANEVINILGNRRIFIFNNSFTCRTTEDSTFQETSISINVKYTQGFKIFRAILDHRLMDKLNKQDNEVLNKIKCIFNNIIKPEMSDFEKEVAVHDFLILTSRYDYENYKNNTIPDISYTPYGLLYKNKAVCSAYSEVFMIFMTLASIECYFVVGDLKETNTLFTSNGHAWNIVKIQDKYYHIDVTSDNPVPDVIGMVKYKYFNVSDNVIAMTHIWDRANYPVCDSMEYNYYNVVNKSRG